MQIMEPKNGPQEDIDSVNIGTKKKKSIKGAALSATAKHYFGKAVNKKNALRLAGKLGRGAVKLGLGAVTAGVGATVGLAAGIASGDPSKALQYAAVGGLAGRKIGAHAGDGVANLAGGAVDGVRGIYGTYNEQKNEIMKYDENAQKEQMKKENKKYARSSEVTNAIKKRYRNLDKDALEEKRAVVERYKNNGINDLDTIFNCHNLEQGKDAFGNDIGQKLDQNQAMTVGRMAESFESDNVNARKSARDMLQLQLSQNYAEQGMGGVAAGKAGKEQAKNVMKYVDMAQGKKYKEAGAYEKQETIKKAYDDDKERQQEKEKAEIQAEAMRNQSN